MLPKIVLPKRIVENTPTTPLSYVVPDSVGLTPSTTPIQSNLSSRTGANRHGLYFVPDASESINYKNLPKDEKDKLSIKVQAGKFVPLISDFTPISVTIRQITLQIVQSQYAELENLFELISRSTNAEKKRHLLYYLSSAKLHLSMLLAIIRFMRWNENMHTWMNAIGVLRDSDLIYSNIEQQLGGIYRDHLFASKSTKHSLSQRSGRQVMSDIPNAMRVLSGQALLNLDNIIARKGTLDLDPRRKEEILDSLQFLLMIRWKLVMQDFLLRILPENKSPDDMEAPELTAEFTKQSPSKVYKLKSVYSGMLCVHIHDLFEVHLTLFSNGTFRLLQIKRLHPFPSSSNKSNLLAAIEMDMNDPLGNTSSATYLHFFRIIEQYVYKPDENYIEDLSASKATTLEKKQEANPIYPIFDVASIEKSGSTNLWLRSSIRFVERLANVLQKYHKYEELALSFKTPSFDGPFDTKDSKCIKSAQLEMLRKLQELVIQTLPLLRMESIVCDERIPSNLRIPILGYQYNSDWKAWCWPHPTEKTQLFVSILSLPSFPDKSNLNTSFLSNDMKCVPASSIEEAVQILKKSFLSYLLSYSAEGNMSDSFKGHDHDSPGNGNQRRYFAHDHGQLPYKQHVFASDATRDQLENNIVHGKGFGQKCKIVDKLQLVSIPGLKDPSLNIDLLDTPSETLDPSLLAAFALVDYQSQSSKAVTVHDIRLSLYLFVTTNLTLEKSKKCRYTFSYQPVLYIPDVNSLLVDYLSSISFSLSFSTSDSVTSEIVNTFWLHYLPNYLMERLWTDFSSNLKQSSYFEPGDSSLLTDSDILEVYENSNILRFKPPLFYSNQLNLFKECIVTMNPSLINNLNKENSEYALMTITLIPFNKLLFEDSNSTIKDSKEKASPLSMTVPFMPSIFWLNYLLFFMLSRLYWNIFIISLNELVQVCQESEFIQLSASMNLAVPDYNISLHKTKQSDLFDQIVLDITWILTTPKILYTICGSCTPSNLLLSGAGLSSFSVEVHSVKMQWNRSSNFEGELIGTFYNAPPAFLPIFRRLFSPEEGSPALLIIHLDFLQLLLPLLVFSMSLNLEANKNLEDLQTHLSNPFQWYFIHPSTFVFYHSFLMMGFLIKWNPHLPISLHHPAAKFALKQADIYIADAVHLNPYIILNPLAFSASSQTPQLFQPCQGLDRLLEYIKCSINLPLLEKKCPFSIIDDSDSLSTEPSSSTSTGSILENYGIFLHRPSLSFDLLERCLASLHSPTHPLLSFTGPIYNQFTHWQSSSIPTLSPSGPILLSRPTSTSLSGSPGSSNPMNPEADKDSSITHGMAIELLFLFFANFHSQFFFHHTVSTPSFLQ